jgi:hypothetical protein
MSDKKSSEEILKEISEMNSFMDDLEKIRKEFEELDNNLPELSIEEPNYDQDDNEKGIDK